MKQQAKTTMPTTVGKKETSRFIKPALTLAGIVALLGIMFMIAGRSNPTQYSPQPLYAATDSTPAPLCSYGVNVHGDINAYDLASLRMGWYVDYAAKSAPVHPNGAEYVPIIRLQQIGANGYSYSPSGNALQAAIAGNPGAAWIIGNEPDRRDWQDDLEPHVYASAYQELYYLIKQADPTAQIFAGAIVQPTPIRLQYLDMVLQSYLDQFGEPLPADGWSIHNFILNEVSCDYNPGNCWGAEIPPGIDADYGEIVTIEDNDNFDLFKERIVRFRQWMANRGYTGLPVYLSEYSILMPEYLGFPPSRVNAFMDKTYDYMQTTTDPVLGDPNDNYRLIQRWSWYSTNDQSYNGALFAETSAGSGVYARTEIGDHFAGYTSVITDQVDVYPNRLYADPVPFSTGQPVTFTLTTRIANSGNLTQPTSNVIVRFYNGDPQTGGVQIGTDQNVTLAGCGDNSTVSVQWNNVPPGVYDVYAVVDPDNLIGEIDDNNNTFTQKILVATHRIFLPVVSRALAIP